MEVALFEHTSTLRGFPRIVFNKILVTKYDLNACVDIDLIGGYCSITRALSGPERLDVCSGEFHLKLGKQSKQSDLNNISKPSKFLKR